jgi:hypothetical protein
METPIWGGGTCRQELLQSISLLRILNEVPEPPSQNIPSSENDTVRCLNISREKEIASNLAFLSATSYNSKEVMAVCVEAHPNGHEITIRVASNTGDLTEVVAGFKKLAKVLERASRRGRWLPLSEIILNFSM